MPGGVMGSKLSWMSVIARVSAIMLLALSGMWSSACSSDDKPPATAKKCTLNSDCDSNLVCSFGLCHKQCEEAKDCGPGQLCVKSDGKAGEGGVCQLDLQSECKFADDCPNPLVCGPDSKCRAPCRYPSARDCLPTQVCALGGVCAEPSEVDKETGGIKGAPLVDAGPGSNDPDSGPNTCVAGGSCTLDATPCRAGTYACVDGERVCQDSGAAADGTACGVDKVCVAGTCADCVQNAECKPDPNDPCKVGTQDCATGVRCVQGANAADGASCGENKVCSGGDCVDCVQGEDCQPEQGDVCIVGKRKCDQGPVCETTGDAPNGTNCGTSRICSDGSCVSCFAGGSCVPANECHQGRRTCTSGPGCEDTGQNVNDGRACATPGEYCVNGACKACTQGDPCTPESAPCKQGYTYCSGGVATCSAQSANAEDGKLCDGDTSACFSGVCTPLDRTIVVKSGDNPTGKIDQFTTTNVVVTVRDKNGAGVSGVQVTVLTSEPAGGFGIPVTTNVSGDATVRLRLGRAVGTYKFKITAIAVATPVEVTATATAPDAGTIYSVVNADHMSGATGGTAGPGTAARINTARDVAVAADGTLYVADYYAVYKVTPAGQMTLFAGKPNTSGTSGDGGQATSALFNNIRALALDETRNLLHIANDGNPGRIRTVNLATGIVGTTAGGGTATPPQDIGGSGLSLNLTNIEDISVSPTGDLYIIESTNNRIIKLDTSDQSSEWLKGGSCVSGGDTSISYFYDGSSMAWDASGRPYLSGYFCNLGINPATALTSYGVVRVDAAGQPAKLVHVAGWNSSGSKSDGVPATNAYFTTAPQIAFDKAGNLYVSLRQDDVIRRVDGATYRIETVAGAPATNPVVYGDYGPATSAQFSSVGPIAFDAANNLYLADSSNYAFRAVWGIGRTTASTYVLTKNGGDNQPAIPLDAQFTAMSVKLVDGAGAIIPNVPIEWARKETGSYLNDRFSATNALAGVASNIGRVGLLGGAYTFDASYADLHGNKTTLTFTATAVAPTAGHIYTTVNAGKTGGNLGVPGPGTAARTQYNENAVAAADGTLYLSNYYAIYKLSPRGELTLLAGAPASGGSVGQGNAGPALNARFSHVVGMALDETRNRLYVTDGGTHVRLINLTTGIINAFAGGGSGQPNFGDDAALDQAEFSNLESISLSADGKSLYGIDRGHNRLREIQIEPASGTPTTKTLLIASTSCQAGVVSMYSLASQYSNVVWLANGEAYISGQVCGTLPGNGAYGIAKRAVNGTLTLIAGSSNTSATSDGVPANTAYFPSIGGIAVDSSGNLYVSISSQPRVRKITFPAGTITTVAGTGTATAAGNPASDYVSAVTSTLNSPQGLAVVRRASGDRLVIADYNNSAFREVW